MVLLVAIFLRIISGRLVRYRQFMLSFITMFLLTCIFGGMRLRCVVLCCAVLRWAVYPRTPPIARGQLTRRWRPRRHCYWWTSCPHFIWTVAEEVLQKGQM